MYTAVHDGIGDAPCHHEVEANFYKSIEVFYGICKSDADASAGNAAVLVPAN